MDTEGARRRKYTTQRRSVASANFHIHCIYLPIRLFPRWPAGRGLTSIRPRHRDGAGKRTWWKLYGPTCPGLQVVQQFSSHQVTPWDTNPLISSRAPANFLLLENIFMGEVASSLVGSTTTVDKY